MNHANLFAACGVCLAAFASRAMTARQIYDADSAKVVVVVAQNSSAPDEVAFGSGSIVSADGLVLTNFHVLCAQDGKQGDRIRVYFKPTALAGSIDKDLTDGVDAAVLAIDPDLDLALLGVPPQAVKVAPLQLSSVMASPGDRTAAIGSPEDGGPWTLTTGALSNRILNFDGVNGKHVYQIETPINPGNSGGALLDQDGNLLGVTTSAVKIGKSGLPTANIQFAIANDVVLNFLSAVTAARVAFDQGSVGCNFGVCRATRLTALDKLALRMAGRLSAAPMAAHANVAGESADAGATKATPVESAVEWGVDTALSKVADAVLGPLSGLLSGIVGEPELKSFADQAISAAGKAAASEAAGTGVGKKVDGLFGAGDSNDQKMAAIVHHMAATVGARPAAAQSQAGQQIAMDVKMSSRPFAAKQLSAVLARDGRPLRAGGSASDRASGARPAASEASSSILAATPSVAYSSPEDAVYRGDFIAALQLARADPTGGSLISGLQQFVEAGKLVERNNFSAARVYFRKASSTPRLYRLGAWWVCKMYRRESRNGDADACFSKESLAEDVRP